MEDKPPSVNKPSALKNPRYSRKFPLSLRMGPSAGESLPGGETLEGESYDISAGGLRFKTEVFLSSGTEVEVTLRLSPSFEPTITARVLRTDTVENEQGESFKLVALQFIGLEPEIQAQIRDILTPKFSFRIQEGSEETAQRRSGSSGVGTRAREAGSEEQDRGEEDAEQGDAEAVGWSKVGITELDPNATEARSEEESEEEGEEES